MRDKTSKHLEKYFRLFDYDHNYTLDHTKNGSMEELPRKKLEEESFSSEDLRQLIFKLINVEGEEGKEKLRTMRMPTAVQIASPNFSFSQFYNI
jgi:hypothetical protein